jgi:hypothetical protein
MGEHRNAVADAEKALGRTPASRRRNFCTTRPGSTRSRRSSLLPRSARRARNRDTGHSRSGPRHRLTPGGAQAKVGRSARFVLARHRSRRPRASCHSSLRVCARSVRRCAQTPSRPRLEWVAEGRVTETRGSPVGSLQVRWFDRGSSLHRFWNSGIIDHPGRG